MQDHDKERRVAENIARVLLNDISIEVRKSLAFEIRNCATIPADIAQKIALDVEMVSGPFLEASNALTDELLIELIPVVEEYSRISIAKRNFVSEKVGMTLVEFAHDATVTILLRNEGAQMGSEIFNCITKRYEHDHPNLKMLARRIDLPPELAEKLKYNIKSRLSKIVTEKYSVELAVDEDLTLEETEAKVRKAHALGRLTPELILDSLKKGNIDFFEISLALLSHSQLDNVQTIIKGSGPAGLEKLLKKAEISRAYLRMFLSGVEKAYKK